MFKMRRISELRLDSEWSFPVHHAIFFFVHWISAYPFSKGANVKTYWKSSEIKTRCSLTFNLSFILTRNFISMKGYHWFCRIEKRTLNQQGQKANFRV